ncbi:MAG: DUF2799 domain-containing protein [Gammaproteobacteria bacterium]|nr:DUF2799 domain-containing protein [Gammaproteobacteria bacterium]
MRKIIISGLAVLAVLLGGCVAHLNRQQCLTMNWYQQGFNDGTAGQPQRDLTMSIQDCAKFKLTVNAAQYKSGWRAGTQIFCTPTYQVGKNDGQQGRTMSGIMTRQPYCQSVGMRLNTVQYHRGLLAGLARFCTYSDGFNIGSQGHQAPNVCPGRMRIKFMQGWRSGVNKFCANISTAFAMGKSGQSYADACDPNRYPGFRAEYDRGAGIYQRIQTLQGRIDDINNQINSIAGKWDLRQDGSYYRLGHKRSYNARRGLRIVRRIVRQRDELTNRLFAARAAR